MTGAKYHDREVYFRNQRIKEALCTDFGEIERPQKSAAGRLQSLKLVTGAKYHPRDVHFRNQRIKEALYTDFGANRGTSEYHTAM